MERGGSVYIITNKPNGTLYTGVTSNLTARIIEHQEGKFAGSFSNKYNLKKLVFFESFSTIEEAIDFEKFVKGKKRQWKLDLIESKNPNWTDLSQEVLSW